MLNVIDFWRHISSFKDTEILIQRELHLSIIMKIFSTLMITVLVVIAFATEKYRAKYLLVKVDDEKERGKLCIYCDI